MLASDAIKSHGWNSNKRVAEGIMNAAPDLAQWVELHPSIDSVFGTTAGIALYLEHRDVLMSDVEEMLTNMKKHRWFWDGMASILHLVKTTLVTIDAKVEYSLSLPLLADKIGEAFPVQKRVTRFLDGTYSIVSKEELARLIKESGYVYGAWVEEKQDCDEWAGRLWGKMQKVNPGNIAIGFATIVGNSSSGQYQGHALLLAVCSDGVVFVENTGAIHDVGNLPGWDNSSIVLDVCVI